MTGQALIYCRISADPEGRAIGVQRQEADCRELAERLGLEVAGIYVENDVSASTSSSKPRPKYAAMLERARAGDIAAVVAYSNSRLTRRVREYLDLIELHRETGVVVRTVVSGEHDLSTADGRGMAINVANWDQMEAERTAERVTRAKRESAANGTYRGGPRPFGYEADGTTIRPREAEAVRTAVQQVLDGVTLGRIAEEWQSEGLVSTRAQKPIRPADVGRILKRARNAGLLDHRGTLTQAVWPPLVSREDWEAVCAILADPARRTNDKGGRPRWLLTGIARCDVCRQTMRHGVTNGQPYYRCKGRACTMRRQDYADEVVHGTVVARLRRPDLADLLHVANPETLKEASELRTRINSLSARLDALAADTSLSERMLAKRAKALEAELDAASTRLDALNSATAAVGPLATVLTAEDPGAAYLASGLDAQRAVVDLLMTVTFLPAGKGRPKGWKAGEPYFDPRTVRIEWRAL